MMSDHTVVIDYTNWRGQRALRRIRPIAGTLTFGTSSFHYEPQWLFTAFDLDKGVERLFAMKDVHTWTTV